jgi:predicted nucleic acid-binding protein
VDRFVLSDAAPLICLAQVDGLSWLGRLFGRIDITQQVLEEIITGRGKPGEKDPGRAVEESARENKKSRRTLDPKHRK